MDIIRVRKGSEWHQHLKYMIDKKLTWSAELSPLLSNGLLNHWEKSSDELKIFGNKKLSSAHNSSRLFYIAEKTKPSVNHRNMWARNSVGKSRACMMLFQKLLYWEKVWNESKWRTIYKCLPINSFRKLKQSGRSFQETNLINYAI